MSVYYLYLHVLLYVQRHSWQSFEKQRSEGEEDEYKQNYYRVLRHSNQYDEVDYYRVKIRFILTESSKIQFLIMLPKPAHFHLSSAIGLIAVEVLLEFNLPHLCYFVVSLSIFCQSVALQFGIISLLICVLDF